MAEHAPPLVFAVLAWWFSTGAILWLVRGSQQRTRWSLLLGGLGAAAALVGLAVTARDPSTWGAYAAFGCALAVWGWHEASFLTGWITGPRRTASPPGLSGWSRFCVASETVMHHEVALAATGLAIVALTWGAPNQTGALTFGLLFFLRLSAKLNIFLGVANPPTALLPEPIVHLASYFRRRPMNPLLPLSLAASAATAALFAWGALRPEAGAGEQAGMTLLFAMAALGLLEHAFLTAPSPERALWGWALGRRSKPLAMAARKP